ncbi:carbohydrate ABC transporter permease [Ruania alkalisoli]|uniref:Carbohydrate ABC transporter permease n=2 Tax=Ruania alkalisoli TaxID=2779775 RepID=A0A7M1SRK9_9MICO|nr:carbohydrate ABC transporter permease [Ruania alkalisoli]
MTMIQPRARANRRRTGSRLGRTGAYLVLLLTALVWLVPLLYLVNTAFKSQDEFLADPTGLASTVSLDSFVQAWQTGGFSTYVLNSIGYVLLSATVMVVLSLLIAFPIARRYIRWSDAWYRLFVISMFLPNALVTQFQLILWLGLYDTRIAYVLLMTAGFGLGPFLITGYLRSVPTDLDEAAGMDGCGYFRYLFTIIAPLAKPVLVTVFIFQAINVWNDIIIATVVLADPAKFPISRGLFAFFGTYGNQSAQLAAATLMVAAPLVLLYAALQKHIVAGAIGGALK